MQALQLSQYTKMSKATRASAAKHHAHAFIRRQFKGQSGWNMQHAQRGKYDSAQKVDKSFQTNMHIR
ncbi:hypothetical protein [Aquitalea sp. ASV11]|uniref:hypothetical protein n=1 Tax=Aquitalea sp. ASV11 TaxID=2795103 RepID=UPI001E46FDFD|nr:hypothetical protein [Aquitalea sp. ASV11]